MRRARVLAGLSVLPLLALGLGAGPAASVEDGRTTASTASARVSAPAAMVELRAAPGVADTLVRTPAPQTTSGQLRQRAARFNVTYRGFANRPAARRAFQSAVNVWKARVSSSVPITVRATFTDLGRGVLGSAGASAVHRNFRGAPKRDTWYVDAIANKRAGRNLDRSPDIVANFNRGFQGWYFGTDGRPPARTYDFKTVVLHELGHGLGFLGAGTVSGSKGSVRFGPIPVSYDRFTENRAGARLLGFPNNSTRLANQLTSKNVFFDSPRVRDANRGNRARLYAPRQWAQGSSYSHLDERTYRPGNRNSLMTPFLDSAEAIHSPGPITNALFRSIGW